MFSIFSLLSARITISSIFLEFILDIGFGFTILSEILFSMNSTVALAVSWTNYLEAVVRASSPTFVTVYST